MKILIANTDPFIESTKVNLTSDVVAGSAISIPVTSSNDLAVGDYVLIGAKGSPTAELVAITAIADNLHITATLKFAHQNEDEITKYLFNQRKFYGSVNSDAQGSTYVELTAYGSPKNIEVNNPQGTAIEYTGGEGYNYFKATYWNTATVTETDLSDAQETVGDDSFRYTTIAAIRKAAGMTNNPYITDAYIEEKRQQAEGEVNSTIMDRYVLPLPYVPALIRRVTTLLAAGYIDYEEYGADGNGGQGKKWLGEARGIINAIGNGTQRLLNVDFTELPSTADVDVSSNPADDGDGDGSSEYSEPIFSIDKLF